MTRQVNSFSDGQIEDLAEKLLGEHPILKYRIGELTFAEAIKLIDFEYMNRRALSLWNNGIFQLWNVEYIADFARALRERKMEPVLEVIAGDGVLSKMLKAQGIDITPTDGKGEVMENYHIPNNPEVLTMEAMEAVKHYSPKTVIASWIPYGDDLDRKLLSTDVENVILIGEAPGGCTGSFGWKDDEIKDFLAKVGRYQDDMKVDKYNICRTDSVMGESRIIWHSRTELFIKGDGSSQVGTFLESVQ